MSYTSELIRQHLNEHLVPESYLKIRQYMRDNKPTWPPPNVKQSPGNCCGDILLSDILDQE